MHLGEWIMQRKTVVWIAIGFAAGVAFYVYSHWGGDKKQEAPAPIPKTSMLAPPGYSLDAPSPPPPRWDPNAARDSKDLHAAFVQARDSANPVAWSVAADIAGACTNVLGGGPRRNIDKMTGDFNSTRTDDLRRTARLAGLRSQEDALAELQQRCKGFTGTNDLAEYSELRAKVEASDSDLGRLLRANQAMFYEDGNPRGESTTQEWEAAATKALASGSPVLTRTALYSMASILPAFGTRPLEVPGHPEVKLDAPQFVGFSAILEAQRRVAGEDSDRNEMETIGACAFAGWCGIRPSYVPNSDEGKALWENVVEQYAAALRANDVKAILAVKPS